MTENIQTSASKGSALLTRLAINDARRGAGFTFEFLAAIEVRHVLDAIQRTVIPPIAEMTKHRAFGGQVFGDVTPPASRAQHIDDAVQNLRMSTSRLRPPRFAGGTRGYASIPDP
jgi:hypothetical protein